MASLTSLTGTGAFQAPSGAPLAFGTMTAALQSDVTLADSQICAEKIVTFNLDANGNILSGSLWAPATYLFTAYSAQGQQVWQGLIALTIPPLPVGQSYFVHPNGNIRFVTPAQTINTLGIPVFSLISGLAIDGAGNLFVADVTADRVYKVTPSLVVSVVAGTGSSGFSGDGGLATACTFSALNQICCDVAGNLYIQDARRIRVVNTQSTTQTLLGISVAAGCIQTVAGNGSAGNNTGDGGAAISAHIFCHSGMCVSAAGLYFTTNNSSAYYFVRFINQSGVINTVAGSTSSYSTSSQDGVLATSAKFDLISGISCDTAGNLYIVEQGAAVIYALNNQATTQTLFGVSVPSGYLKIVTGIFNTSQSSSGDGGPALSAHLYVPQWVSFDVSGNLYVYQNNAPAVRQVSTSTHIITTVIGTGVNGFSGDGGPATSAKINAIIAPLAILR